MITKDWEKANQINELGTRMLDFACKTAANIPSGEAITTVERMAIENMLAFIGYEPDEE